MKRCPKCNRTYQDDNQKFCTVDGGRLESDAHAETTYDLSPTVITNQADLNLPPPPSEPATDLNKTMASLPPQPTGEIRRGESGSTTSRTIAAPFQPADAPAKQPPPPAPQPPPQSYQPPPERPQQHQPPQPPPVYQQPPPQQPQQPPAYQPQPYQQQPQYQQPPAYQQPPPPPAAPLQHAPTPTPAQPQAGQHAQSPAQQRAATTPKKGSRLPLIIGALVVVLLASAAAYYFLVLNKKESADANTNSNANVANANSNANTNLSANTNGNSNTTANANTKVETPYVPPANATEFANSRDDLSGKIAEHFVPFSFYYPDSWELDSSVASGGTYFVRVERKLPPDFTQERLAVGWYESNGTYDADKSLFPNLVEATSAKLEKLPGYEKLSEGETKVNSMDAYEFRFKGLTKNTEKGDITFWGRIIFLPPGDAGQKNGLQLTILTSSLAPELEGIDDVGVKGELPIVLESFRLKK